MDVIYCQKCHNKKRGLNYDNARSQIAEMLDIDFDEVEDGCTSFCGPGTKMHFVEVDSEMLYAETFEGLLEQLKDF